MKLYNKKGFTLIELLVVIAIIGLLSSVVLASLSGARSSARDTQIRQDLRQLRMAVELYYNDNGSYPGSTGWVTGDRNLTSALVPEYISKMPFPPSGSAEDEYQYWRKDSGSYCFTPVSDKEFVLYADLENPNDSDLATINDQFDNCAESNWDMDYAVGNE